MPSLRAIIIADEDDLVGQLDPGPVDLLISLGDLSDYTMQRAFDHYRPRKVFAVRGNHDSPAPLPAFAPSLHNRVEEFGGLTFGGLEGSWKYKPKGHYLYDQAEVSALMAEFPPVDVLICHNSPMGIHERDGDIHQGFEGLLAYINRTKPRLLLHGHQHVDLETRIGETLVKGVFGECLMHLGA